jgi:hypothetical protein
VLTALVLVGLVLWSYAEVAFLGRTLTTSAGSAGVAGDAPAPGQGPLDFDDTYRRDRGAAAWAYQPWAAVTNRILEEGSEPLWTPYQAGGAPLAANMQSAVFDPLMLPVHLDPSPRMWDLSFLAVFVAATLATYALGRVLGLGRAAAFVAAVVHFLSGFWFMNSNNQFVRVYMYLPVVFLAVEFVARSVSRVAVVLLGAAIAGTLLAGMPESSFFVLAAAGAYGAYRTVWGARSAGRTRMLVRLAEAAVVGLALAAPLLLLFAEYLGASFHLHRPGVGLLADEPRWVVDWVLPLLNGPPARPRTGAPTVRDWVGMAAVALGAVALTAPGPLRRTGGPFFAGCAAVVLLKQFGVPPFQWLGLLPPADLTIFPVFAVPVAAFCLALLAGIGVQALGDGEVRPGRCSIALLVVLGLVAAGLAANRAVLDAASAPDLLRNLGIAAGALLLVSVAATLAVRGRRAAGVLLALVAVVCELALFIPRGIYPRRADPYVRPPWLDAVVGARGEAGTGRVAGFAGALYPNTAGVFGLQDVRVLEALYVERYVRYLRTFVEPEFDDRFTGHSGDESTRPNVDGNPMWDLLGVRWLIAAGGQAVSPFLNRVFAAVTPGPDLGPALFDAAGDRRPALRMAGAQEVAYPVYEGAPGSVAFSWAVSPDTTPGPGSALALDAVTPLGRVPVWRRDLTQPPPDGGWVHEVLSLEAAGPVQSLVLRAEGLGPEGVVAWAGLSVAGTGGSPPPDRMRTVAGDGFVQVVEDAGRMPRALVVHRAHAVADADEAVAHMSRGADRFADGAVRVRAFDPRVEAVVEAPAAVVRSFVAAADDAAAASEAEIASYEPDRVEVVVRGGRPGLLVLTDVFYPGWKATVNGRPAEIHPVNLAFRGVGVGAGTSTVVFTYEPLSFRVGVAVAALVGVLALVSLLLGRRHGGGRRPAAPTAGRGPAGGNPSA